MIWHGSGPAYAAPVDQVSDDSGDRPTRPGRFTFAVTLAGFQANGQAVGFGRGPVRDVRQSDSRV